MELKVNGLIKRIGDFTAVNDVELLMTRGVYGLLGVNGAGKTTLMRMLCTLISPTEGNITCDGNDIYDMGASYRKLIGYLPQEFGYYPEFSVEDYLHYVAALKGIRPIVAQKRTKVLLEWTGLANVAKKKMKKLSGGMKRRAGIAQAMLNDPKILILDEPTAGLDPRERVRFRNLLGELSGNRLILLSTHIVSDVEYVANEILMMKSGRIIRKGTSEEIVDSMKERVWECVVESEDVAAMMKRFRISNMRSEGRKVRLRVISLASPLEGAVPVRASLEDAFLYYFGEKAGEKNAEI